jgi:hypothetical protein
MDTAVVDLGQVRGLALMRAKGARIRHVVADVYSVPSASGTGGYVVDVAQSTCTCPAFEETGVRCKHQWAVSYFRRDLPTPVAESIVSTSVRRPTYPQNWPAYNRAQCQEEERVRILLRELCHGIVEEPQHGRGRPRIPLGDAIFCATLKVYGTMSGRRSMTDMRSCEDHGFIERVPAYNSIFRFVERPDLLPLLTRLVAESARPLAAVEPKIAVDSTGFATQTYVRWFDYKHGEDRRVQKWVKLHASVGTFTNVIIAAKVTGAAANDSPEFAGLVERTVANGFHPQEVSGDKAYLSHANLAAVEAVGAKPYIPFKTNSGSSGSAAWERLYHLFSLHQEAFASHYHARSNVEATFSALKRKFGGSVRSKLPAAQFNEVLLKCLCFNLSMLVHAIHELRIDPKFWTPKPANA